MARSRRRGGSVRVALRFSSVAVAGLAMRLPLASCAAMVQGTTQTVPISSRPDEAEVFVDGVSAGFTPMGLELARGREHAIEVRLGSQTRSLTLRSEVHGAMVGLDLVPVAVAGGIGLTGPHGVRPRARGGSSRPALRHRPDRHPVPHVFPAVVVSEV